MKTNQFILAASVCMAVLITGCKKQNDVNPQSASNSSITVHGDIESQDGVLRFKDWGTFKKTVAKLEKNEKVTLPSNFTSLKNVFEKVVEAEVALAKEKEKNEANRAIDRKSDVYNINKTSVFYTTLKDGSSILEMDIYSDALSQVVNKNGLVLINDSLLIYSKYKADVCLDYNRETLKNFNKSNYSSNGITTKQMISITKFENSNTSSQSAKDVACNYCVNDDYHYNTTVWNYGGSNFAYQSIMEVFVEQVRENCITYTNVKFRGRFLTRFPYSGAWVPYYPTDMYFAASFSGPKTPTTYYSPNPFGYTHMASTTDYSYTHCYDQSVYPNCFAVSHATYQMLTAYDPFTSTDVIW